MASSLFGDKSTISDHVGRGKRKGIASKGGYAFKSAYFVSTTETAAVSIPPWVEKTCLFQSPTAIYWP